jgi:hypothetical protein
VSLVPTKKETYRRFFIDDEELLGLWMMMRSKRGGTGSSRVSHPTLSPAEEGS